MDLLPTFLKLSGRRVLVVGAGPVALSKLEGLTRTGAHITVVAPAVHPSIPRPGLRIERRAFAPADLDGVWYVVAAATADVNAAVAREAERRQVFVNAVDDPANASAYLGGVVRRADVTIAISTGGSAPALAGVLREAVDALLPDDLDRWSACARELRRTWKQDGIPMGARRPQLIDALKGLYP